MRPAEEGGKAPLEFLGAVRCDPKNPNHRKLVGEIIESHLKAIKETPSHFSIEGIEHWTRPSSVILEEMKGQILINAIPDTKLKELSEAGILPNLGGIFAELSGIAAFRGKCIQYCDLVPEELRKAAFKDRDAESMKAYAEELAACIPQDKLPEYEVLKPKAMKHDDETATIPDWWYDLNNLIRAVAWLRYWSQYPVKLFAWY